jgi:hypothetical protein
LRFGIQSGSGYLPFRSSGARLAGHGSPKFHRAFARRDRMIESQQASNAPPRSDDQFRSMTTSAASERIEIDALQGGDGQVSR